MSGLDATRELRRLESQGLIPPQRIIALTGNAREAQIQNALGSGMDEVVVSAYSDEHFIALTLISIYRLNHTVYPSY